MKDNSKRSTALFVAGIALIVIGIAFNEWSITTLFNPIGLATPQLSTLILIFDVLCVLTGVVLIRYRTRIKGREIAFAAITFITFLLLMEGGVRIFYFVKDKLSPQDRSLSEYLGWDIKPNVRSERVLKGFGKVSYSTVQNGFREFGDVNTSKIKIFVIGDSVTQAYTVSDGNAYYDYLKKKSNDIELFAYGCGGYGSLQEYMITDKYFDLIKPDVILWQFSDNDIINNDYGLESASHINNNHMIRPYLINGKIEWRYPEQSSGWMRRILQSSYLLRFLSIRLRIFAAENIGTIEDTLSEDHPLMKRAVKTTSEIMNMARKRAGATPIIAFTALEPKWAEDTFMTISKESSIHYIRGVADAVAKAKASGVVVDGSPYDGHWNATGHAIAGKMIFDYLLQNGFIHAKKRS